MTYITLNNRKRFTLLKDVEISADIVSEAIKLHRNSLFTNYQKNEQMYMSEHAILKDAPKAAYKPDNRLVINYAKYIVDTFSGYHIGVPATVTSDDDTIKDFVADFRSRNDMEDTEFELAKQADIFGHSFLYVYQNEEAETCVTYESPLFMLIVYDNSIQERPVFAVRYAFTETEGGVSSQGYGEVITDSEVIKIEVNQSYAVTFGDRTSHIYNDLPVIELIENEERQGIFDSVKTLINALNKAASEKANDVDYFADAYLKIIGVELDEEVNQTIRDSRIFNLWSNGDGQQVDVAFLEKPNADTTQENLITLLKESIFSISMVANLSAEDFGNASGTALAFKLQAMDNLAKMKDRKMQSAFNRLYKVVLGVPKTSVPDDGYKELRYQFTRNVPRNILEESQIVTQLNGQVSDETKLSVLSIVQNPKDELERLHKEEQEAIKANQKQLESLRFDDGQLEQEGDKDDDRLLEKAD